MNQDGKAAVSSTVGRLVLRLKSWWREKQKRNSDIFWARIRAEANDRREREIRSEMRRQEIAEIAAERRKAQNDEFRGGCKPSSGTSCSQGEA